MADLQRDIGRLEGKVDSILSLMKDNSTRVGGIERRVSLLETSRARDVAIVTGAATTLSLVLANLTKIVSLFR
jgi:hypothetical protein